MRRIAVDLCEYLLNLDASNFGDILDMLRHVEHPGASELLWVIVRGTYGSDLLRASALQILQERGQVERNMSLKMFVNRDYQDVYIQGVSLNKDYQFCDPPPGEWFEVYAKGQKASRKRRPNWKAIGEDFWRLTQAVPEFVPGHFNYAVTLANQGRRVEAEAILRKLMVEHPDYLFAPAALVRLLRLDDRIAEVEEIIQAVNLPAETHPEAYVVWLLAQVDYFAVIGKKAEATAFLKRARDIDPDNPAIDLATRLNHLGSK